MTVQLRAALDAVPSYVPGRSAETVAAAYGLDSVVKLSSNEAAHGPLPGVLVQAAAETAETHRYPDTVSTSLRGKLAAHYGLDADRLAIGSGSVSLLQQLVTSTAGPGDEVLFAWRSFEAYPVFPLLAGATPVKVPITAAWRHDLDAMAEAITDATRLIMLCTPNNPTGTSIGAAELEVFLAKVPENITVVIDEAYREYSDEPGDQIDGLEVAARYPNVGVLRTFSKAYGLAALRVGWFYGPPELASAVRKSGVPFAVGALAQRAAELSLERGAEVRERAAEVVSERARVQKEIRSLDIEVPDSQGNFVWLPVGARATALAAALEEHGVITRPYAGDGVRVTIGLPHENDRFLAALPGALASL